MIYFKKYQITTLAVLFGIMFCASLMAQKNCTVCNTPMQEVRGQWLCPNCKPDESGATAINTAATSLYDVITRLPFDMQEGFIIRLSAGKESESALIAEAEKEAQQFIQQQMAPVQLGGGELVTTEEMAARLRDIADRFNDTVRQQQRLLELLTKALKSAGAIEVQPGDKHEQAATSSVWVLQQLVNVPLNPVSETIATMGLEFMFSTNEQVGFTSANILALTTELQQGNQIQVIITMDQQPNMAATLMPDIYPVPDTPQEQQGGHLVMAGPVFVAFNQLAAAFLNILGALKEGAEEGQEFSVYFFKRTSSLALYM